MGQILIRNIQDILLKALKENAQKNGRSLESEARLGITDWIERNANGSREWAVAQRLNKLVDDVNKTRCDQHYLPSHVAQLVSFPVK